MLLLRREGDTMDFTLGIRHVVVLFAAPSFLYCLTTLIKNNRAPTKIPLWKHYIAWFIILLLGLPFVYRFLSFIRIEDTRDIIDLCLYFIIFTASSLLFNYLTKYSDSNRDSSRETFGRSLLIILCQIAIIISASPFVGMIFYGTDSLMNDQGFYHQNWFYSAAVLMLFYSLSFPLRLKYELSHASLYHYFLDFMLINAVAGIISAEMFYSNKWHHLLVPVAPQIIGFMFIFLFAILYAAYYYTKRNNYNLTWLPTIVISFLHCVILGMLYSFYQVVYLGILYLLYPDT